jgi:site-specific recombinase XerD
MSHKSATLNVLRHANRSQSTQETYCRELARFFRCLGHTDLIRIQRERLIAYLAEIGGRSIASRKTAHAALRFFFVCVVNRPELMEGIPWPRQPRSLREGPRWTDVLRLIEAVPDPVCRAVARVMAGAGLRVREACALRITDVRPEKDAHGRFLDHGVLFVRGKGAKERLAPLPPCLLQALRAYYEQFRPTDFLFVARRGRGRVTAEMVRRELRLAAARCGIEPVTPHQLRHAFATTMLERGVSIATIQSALGHRHLSTTIQYLHIRHDTLAAMPDLLKPPQS